MKGVGLGGALLATALCGVPIHAADAEDNVVKIGVVGAETRAVSFPPATPSGLR